ncbi:MAG: cation-translocating P-type ATPase [Acidobacteria bacterium]|nr:cation-translocating P-type ATPase [Acidobacteriota bacterium]
MPVESSALPESQQHEAWHSQASEDVLASMEATIDGLSSVEAARRLKRDGANELKEGQRVSALRILAAQFNSVMIWILIAAGAISGLLGEKLDAIAILAIVALNAAIGFYQEFRAERSIAALKKMTAPKATVRRDGELVSIPATGIVTGDILALEAGDLIGADARIITASSLKCVESPLTGESEAVMKDPAAVERVDTPLGDRKNLVFLGTSVAAGRGEAVVVATAMNTELGRIARLLQVAGEDDGTPLQRRLDALGRILLWAALAAVGLLFGLGWLRGAERMELFLTSISLAVAAVPEGLPAIVTVALSVGVLRLARRGALVRKLAAVETLGSTSVICTDKTGTLTVGEMTARSLYVGGSVYQVTGEGYGPEGEVQWEGKKAEGPQLLALRELANIMLGCNSSHLVQDAGVWKTLGDPTEGALLVAGAKAGGNLQQIEKELPKAGEVPFDSDRKRSVVIRRMPDGAHRAFINGAPNVVLDLSTQLFTGTSVRPMTAEDRQSILDHTSEMAGKALRVIASGYANVGNDSPGEFDPAQFEHDLVFVGLTGMYDPPRPEGKGAIAKCHAAGVKVVMITGDHPRTAGAIAAELGIGGGAAAVTGTELDQMSAEQLQQRVPEISVYARVTAEHKLRIVHALKATGAVVAMTGDGVNDAPAIKGADIGIAMGKSGTEVTKQAADLILTDDNFTTIVAAVEEGRGIYNNIRKALQYMLAGNTGELILMAGCVALGMPSPLLPIHLLWINLVTDGLPALALATDVVDADVMKLPPRPRAERITDRSFLRTMLLTGVLTAAVAFGVFFYGLQTGSLATARGSAFAVLVFAELLRSFGVRSETKPLWKIPLWSNRNLVIVVAISIGLQVWSQHSTTLGSFLKTPPMTFSDCLRLLALGAIPLALLECVKVIKHFHRHTTQPPKALTKSTT